MPLVEEEKENPIQLEVKPKVKRVYTEEQKKALCDRLAKAREIKAQKRQASGEEPPASKEKKNFTRKKDR